MVGGVQRIKPNFGANSKRTDLIGRDVAIMPFGDPTHKMSPSPDKYQTNPESNKQKTMVLQTIGASMPLPEIAMQNAFANAVQRGDPGPRDNVPGPGSYDTQIQDKLKVLNYQLSTRYHLKPFGSG